MRISDEDLGRRTSVTYERLRELIVEGELEAGSERSQLELTRMLGVSRTPLREALRQLESDGLVSGTDPHRLVRISPLSMSDLEGLYMLRLPSEALAAWHTVNTLTVADLATLRAAADSTANAEHAVARRAHRLFHSVLCKGATPRVQAALRNMLIHSERYQLAFVVQSKTGRGKKHAEHLQIIKACEAADRRGVCATLVDHLASTALALMRNQGYEPTTLLSAIEMTRTLYAPDVDGRSMI